MGCTKQLSIAAAASDQFTPLNSAVYVPSTQEILGASENYICRFNASTGAYINQVKAAPVMGRMHLGLVNNLPWVSMWNEKEVMANSISHPLRDIFPVDATTLALGVPLDADTRFGGVLLHQWWGPATFVSIGTGIYFIYQLNGQVQFSYINSANHAQWNSWTLGFVANNIGTDGTFVYCPDNFAEQIRYFNAAGNSVDWSDTTGYKPVATEWVNHSNPTYKKCYAVCGNKWLIRVDVFATSSNTYIDLDALTGQTDTNPTRIRFNPTDDLVYMPCQNKNAVIVYDPAAGTAIWKTGFDSPIDVVFSLMLSGKKFAVQSGLVGLKEIV